MDNGACVISGSIVYVIKDEVKACCYTGTLLREVGIQSECRCQKSANIVGCGPHICRFGNLSGKFQMLNHLRSTFLNSCLVDMKKLLFRCSRENRKAR